MTIAPTQRIAASGTAATGLTDTVRPSAPVTKKPSPYVQFEAYVLQSFIQSIMPQNATDVFGEGTSGEVWKSMLAEKMAMQVAQSGGIGIAKLIAPKEYATPADALAAGQAVAKSTTAAKLLDMQLSASPSATVPGPAAFGLIGPAPAKTDESGT